MFLAERQFDIADPGCHVKMYVYNIRFEFQMEIEQSDVVSDLHREGMKLPAIVVEPEPTAVYHEDAFDENRVKHLPRQTLSPLASVRIYSSRSIGDWPGRNIGRAGWFLNP
jgi:hypothetical protein